MRRIPLLIGVCLIQSLLLFSTGRAQGPVQNVIVPPPPNSASGANAVDFAADLHTGIADISIPLFNVTGRKLSHPIFITYQCSGIKVSEIAGPVGLGWSLNAGGTIARVMRGRPDELDNGFFEFAAAIPDQSDNIPLATKIALAENDYDMIPDMFYLNTSTLGGKFLFDNQLKPQMIPMADVKISVDDNIAMGEFTVRTPDGTKYIFVNGETSTVNLPSSTITYKSTWYLTQIISVDNVDTIRFKYEVATPYTYSVAQNGFEYFYFNVPSGASKSNHEIQQDFLNSTISVSGTKYLKSIEYSRGKVVFQYGSRTDHASQRKLETLTIYLKNPVSGAFSIDRTIHFTYGYFQNEGSGTRLRLDYIKEVSNGGIEKSPYQFFYTDKKLPAVNSAAQDHWGYYNGKLSNTNLVPALTHSGQTISTNNREIDTAYVAGCMLKKVITPLGGVTEYKFESNFHGTGTPVPGPGLRIARVTTKDPWSDINSVVNYEYEGGILVDVPNYTTELIVKDGPSLTYSCLLINVQPTGVGSFASTPVIYGKVRQYAGNNVSVAGKSEYSFSTVAPRTRFFPYFPATDDTWLAGNLELAEHFKHNSGQDTIISKIDHTYTIHATYIAIKGLKVAYNKFFLGGATITSSDFTVKNYTDSVKFQYVSKTETYQYDQKSKTNAALTTEEFSYDNVANHLQLSKISTTTSETGRKLERVFKYPFDFPATGIYGTMQALEMRAYPIETKTVLDVSGTRTVIDFDKTDYAQWLNGGIYPQYVYQAKFVNPVAESTFNASPSTYYKLVAQYNKYDNCGYPIEAQIDGGIPGSAVIDKRHGIPIAGVSNATADRIAFTSFESSDNGQWTINAGSQTQTGSRTLTENGVVTSFTIQTNQTVNYTYTVTKTAGPSPILTFAKTGQPDIEKTLNLPSGSGSVSLTAGTWFAYLSFDTNVSSVQANFSFQYTHYFQPNIISTDAKTGANCLSLTTTHTISKTGLPAGDYVVSYYQKGGAVTFGLTGGGTVSNTETIAAGSDGWTHVKKAIHITGTGNTIQLTGSGIKIDELRLYPVDGIMSTTSLNAKGQPVTQTDANMRSVFNEYDVWGRLTLQRNHNKEIIQQYQYRVAGN
ncbi:MAG: hypothetical protein LOY03_11945 [Cyclobacteriaceae bacterium]|jgi:hypothetical protein|nr:hypothetical protein [Cyclobacteriaceae bacterium]